MDKVLNPYLREEAMPFSLLYLADSIYLPCGVIPACVLAAYNVWQ